MLQSFPVGSVQIDFPASPNSCTFVLIAVPWTNTAEGAHIIQVSAEPAIAQPTADDEATRLIAVGPAPWLEISKTFVLLMDADGNGIPTPGDTLQYTISYTNTGDADLTGGTLLDDYGQGFLGTPSSLEPGGEVSNGTIRWNIGTIGGHRTGSVSYLVQIQPASAPSVGHYVRCPSRCARHRSNASSGGIVEGGYPRSTRLLP